MGTLKTFVDSKGITEKHVLAASNRVEQGGTESRMLQYARVKKRRTKDLEGKKYAELNLAKPKSMRGLSAQQWHAALADKPLSTRVRGKIFRAVNAALATKKQAAVEMKALFEGTTVRIGKKPKEAAKAEAKK
jgi:hypothetical protein